MAPYGGDNEGRSKTANTSNSSVETDSAVLDAHELPDGRTSEVGPIDSSNEEEGSPAQEPARKAVDDLLAQIAGDPISYQVNPAEEAVNDAVAEDAEREEFDEDHVLRDAQSDLIYQQWVKDGRQRCQTCRAKHPPPCRHTKRPSRKRPAENDDDDAEEQPAKKRSTGRRGGHPKNWCFVCNEEHLWRSPDGTTYHTKVWPFWRPAAQAPPPGPPVPAAPPALQPTPPPALSLFDQCVGSEEGRRHLDDYVSRMMGNMRTDREKIDLFYSLFASAPNTGAAAPAVPQPAHTYASIAASGMTQGYTYDFPTVPQSQNQPPLRGQNTPRGRSDRGRGRGGPSSRGGQNTAHGRAE